VTFETALSWVFFEFESCRFIFKVITSLKYHESSDSRIGYSYKGGLS